jgi:hypothetical protein
MGGDPNSRNLKLTICAAVENKLEAERTSQEEGLAPADGRVRASPSS